MDQKILKYGPASPGLGERTTLINPSVVDDLVKNRDKKPKRNKKSDVAEILKAIDYLEKELKKLRKIVKDMEQKGDNESLERDFVVKYGPPESGKKPKVDRSGRIVFKYGSIEPNKKDRVSRMGLGKNVRVVPLNPDPPFNDEKE